jgi:hypothetical protein
MCFLWGMDWILYIIWKKLSLWKIQTCSQLILSSEVDPHFQIFRTEWFTNFSSYPCVLHTLPISLYFLFSFLLWVGKCKSDALYCNSTYGTKQWTKIFLGKELDWQFINKSYASYGNQNLLPCLSFRKLEPFESSSHPHISTSILFYRLLPRSVMLATIQPRAFSFSSAV